MRAFRLFPPRIVSLIRVVIFTFAALLASSKAWVRVCKPTVASILLPVGMTIFWQRHSLVCGTATNISWYSKRWYLFGGTSGCWREITADKLVCWVVAKNLDYIPSRADNGLICSGQGWAITRHLATPDAGFETGHACGKSLRTVKSCVGNSWCRYGVDDRVGWHCV